MAAPARRKKRRRAGSRAKGSAGGGKRTRSSRAVRRLDDSLNEWRFEPTASKRSIIAVVLFSLGGVALGVGVYGQWFRAEGLEALTLAPYLLVAGLALVVAYVVVGRGASSALHIGDLGIGFEGGGGAVRRIPWYELSSIALGEGALKVTTEGRPLRVSLREHQAAVRRLLAEAAVRIPDRLDVHEDERDRIGEPGTGEGEATSIEPPQVTGERCMSSDEPLTFEKDVRMCSRCAALYHKTGVPRRCVGCGAKLRG